MYIYKIQSVANYKKLPLLLSFFESSIKDNWSNCFVHQSTDQIFHKCSSAETVSERLKSEKDIFIGSLVDFQNICQI